MRIQDIFIGRPIYWAMLVAVIAVLALLGMNSEHVRNFVPFMFTLLGLTAAAVAVIVLTYRPGERITREPLEGEPKKSE